MKIDRFAKTIVTLDFAVGASAFVFNFNRRANAVGAGRAIPRSLRSISLIVGLSAALLGYWHVEIHHGDIRPISFAVAMGFLPSLGDFFRRLRRGAGEPRSRPWTGRLRVAEVIDETAEVRTFRLVPTTGSRLPFEFLPGQHLNLTLVVEGREVQRSYTIASPPSRLEYCDLTVKREERGLASRHLHEAVHAGSLLDVRAPAGRFTFTGAEADGIVMIAGGVGITPLMAKIRYLTDLNWPGRVDLVFSVKTERDVIFREELETLGRRHPNLHVVVTLTRDVPAGWSGERGRISPELLTRFVPGIAARRVHVCGPTEMTDLILGMLRDLGVPDESIQTESFASPSRTVAVAPDVHQADSTVTFARSGKSAPAPRNQTVLEIGESLGLDLNYDCRAGVCGTCKVKLLSGRVAMDTEAALESADRANNMILACQARCVDQVVVDA